MRTGRAIYAGSFDPPTRGHRWVIEEARQIFPDLEVLVAQNTGKKPLFDYNARVEMLKTMHGDVSSFKDQLVARYALNTGADAIVRGVRSSSDFDYEVAVASVNAEVSDHLVPTVFFIPPPELRHVSSSLVKSLIGLEDWEEIVSEYVTSDVLKIMLENMKKSEWRW